MIDNYDKLTLGTYERLLDIQGDENEVTLEVLAVLSGRTVDELMNMPLDDYFAIRAGGAFLLSQPEKAKVRDRYDVGAFTLVPVRKMRDMTAAQFIDFQEWSRQSGRHLAETLSCFLVPEGKAYGEGYDPADVVAAIRENMGMRDVAALDAFFFYSSLRYMADTLCSLERMLTPAQRRTSQARTLRRALRALRRSGDGWRRWTPLLTLPVTLGTMSMPSPSSSS